MTHNEKVILWTAKFMGYLSTIIVVGFFALIIMMFFFPIQGGNRELMYSCIGGLGTGTTLVLSYYFGDSKRLHYKENSSDASVTPVEATKTTDL